MNRPQWEAYAPQDNEVIQIIDRLKHICGGTEVEHGWALKQKKKQEEERAAGVNSLSKGVVGLYQRLRSEIDENGETADYLAQDAERELSRLREYQAHCDAVAEDIGCTASLLQDIGANQTLASDKTSSLHQTCNKLLEELEELQQRASKLREPLNYFNRLGEHSRLLGMPMIGSSLKDANQPGKFLPATVRPGSDAFLEVLEYTEASINYFEQRPEYKDGALYLKKFGQLRLRAFTLIKDKVSGYLEKAGRAASAEHSSGKKCHLSESSLIYTKFRAVSHKVSENMKLLQDVHFPHVFTECQERYFSIRLSLLRPAVRAQITDMLRGDDLVSMVRFGAVYFMRLCELEILLYSYCGMDLNERASDMAGKSNIDAFASLMPKNDGTSSTLLTDSLQTLCEELYHALRPKVLHEDSIDKLCELISVTQEELKQESQRSGKSCALALEIPLNRLIRDTQERVILLAHKMISVEIRDFKPDLNDLAYPDILISSQQKAEMNNVDHSITANADGTTTQPPSDEYRTWYPPVNSTMTLLSKLYEVVDMTVFEAVACSTVAACTAALMAAAPNISPITTGNSNESLPSDGLASYLHRQLFLVKHLVTLQEQLVPFNIHFLQNDRRLGFNTTRSAVRKFLRGRFNNVRQGLPLVYEVEMDVRRDMEVALKESCNSFVSAIVEASTKPITSFLVKAKVFRDHNVVVSPEGDDDGNVSQSSPLLQQSFAQTIRVMEMLKEAYEAMSSNLTISKEILSLWLQCNAIESTLMNPVRRKVSDILRELRVFLGDCYSVQDVAEFADPLERMMIVVNELDCPPLQHLSPSSSGPNL